MSMPFIELGTSPGDWWKLPLSLRQRWWEETDYGRNDPSDDLRTAVHTALQKGTTMTNPDPKDPAPADPAPKPADPPPAEQKPADDEGDGDDGEAA